MPVMMVMISSLRLFCGRCPRLIAGAQQRRWFTNSGNQSQSHGFGGRLMDSKDSSSPYKPGQFFIHEKLGYRGVITAAWKAKVYTYDTSSIATPVCSDESQDIISDNMHGNMIKDGYGTLFGVKKHKFQLSQVSMKLIHASANDIVGFKVPVKESEEYWYQVMADRRDFASDIRTNIACRNLSISPISLEYVDYVNHGNILPIVPDDVSSFYDNNFINIIFHKELTDDDEPRAIPRDLYAKWHKSTSAILQNHAVYETKAHGISIKAIPFYAFQGQFCHNWLYKIMIESDENVDHCLIQRLWVTQDAFGQVDLIIGRGVVGYEPKFSPNTSFFSYSSKTFLDSEDGIMGGFYTFIKEDEDGHILHVPTPTFMLSYAKPPESQEVDTLLLMRELRKYNMDSAQTSVSSQAEGSNSLHQSPLSPLAPPSPSPSSQSKNSTTDSNIANEHHTQEEDTVASRKVLRNSKCHETV
eukprot:m.5624 g.5624  ORF g.5624 m.5624 type:complete len:470 (-) comp2440_c0_seq1:258-1667(-)